MAQRTASLLTKTQRRRLANDFADLDERKTRRDKQQIRDRLRSGVFDSQLLVDYPDRQLKLAFEDVDDADLEVALADSYLLIERLRELHGIGREELVTSARRRSERTGNDGETLSLDTLDLRTPTEIREDTRREMLDRLGASRWQRRARGLIRAAGVAFLPFFLIILDETFGSGSLATSIGGDVLSVSVSIGVVLLLSGLAIHLVRALKRDVVPSILALAKDPRGTIRDAWDRL